ncbi:hypothetical protein QBC43DRAFT_352704 [Cladorrhinum sp. PSN259]|nr:hypothetical protein QBC43DRAFT_352704 [Cladorrhinum sp. PSN259]
MHPRTLVKYLILVAINFHSASSSTIDEDEEPTTQRPNKHAAYTDPVICGVGLNASAGGADGFYIVEAAWDIPLLHYREGQVSNWLSIPPHTQGIALGGGGDCKTQIRASTRSILAGQNNTATRIDISILPHPWFPIPVNMSSFEIMVNDTVEARISLLSSKKAHVIFKIHTTYEHKTRPDQTANYTIDLIENGHETWANITLQNWDGHKNIDLLKHKRKDNFYQHLNARNVSFCTDSAWWFITEATPDRRLLRNDVAGEREREYVPRFSPTSFKDMKVSSSKYQEDAVSPEDDPDAKYYKMVNGDDVDEELCYVESVQTGRMVLRSSEDEL